MPCGFLSCALLTWNPFLWHPSYLCVGSLLLAPSGCRALEPRAVASHQSWPAPADGGPSWSHGWESCQESAASPWKLQSHQENLVKQQQPRKQTWHALLSVQAAGKQSNNRDGLVAVACQVSRLSNTPFEVTGSCPALLQFAWRHPIPHWWPLCNLCQFANLCTFKPLGKCSHVQFQCAAHSALIGAICGQNKGTQMF